MSEVQFPTIWPEALVRLAIALGLLQALVVAIIIGTEMHAERRHRGDHEG